MVSCRIWPAGRVGLGLAVLAILLWADGVVAQSALKAEIVPQVPHSSGITSVAFSSDGTRVVSGSADMTLKLWDVATGRLLRTFEGHRYTIESVAFSPNGAQVLSGSLDLKLWNAATGTVIRTFRGHSAQVNSVAFSPDGKRVLSGGAERSVMLWNAATGAVIRTFVHSSWVRSVAFSPDGRRVLAGCDDKTLHLWDVATGALIRTYRDAEWINSVAFSPDGTRFLSGSGFSQSGALKLWSAASGTLIRTFEGHSTVVKSVAFSPDGVRVLSGGEDNTLRLWDAASGTLLHILYASASIGAFSPDGARIVSASNDPTLKLWDVATGNLIRAFEGANVGWVNSVAFSPDGTRFLSADTNVKVWDAASGALIRSFEQNADQNDAPRVFSVAFSPDAGRVLSGGYGKLKLWNASTGALISTFEGHAGHVKSVAFSPDGRHVLSGSATMARMIGGLREELGSKWNKTLVLWDTGTSALVGTFNYTDWVNSVAFSPDGSRVIAANGYDKTLTLWDAGTSGLIATFKENSTVTSVAFSPDGKRVLSGGYKEITLRDAATGTLIRTFEGHEHQVDSLVFSPDGNRVLSGGADNTLKLWDAATGALIRTFRGHSNSVTSVAFSPDGTRVLSGSQDTTVRLWNAATGELLTTSIAGRNQEWLTITPQGFFASSARGSKLLSITREVQAVSIDQIHQSLFSPDLVREALDRDANGDVRKAAKVIHLEKVLDSGPPPTVVITSPSHDSQWSADLVAATARITDKGKGVGRIEWRVNGVTAAVVAAPPSSGTEYTVSREVALDAGENTIEVIAYNRANLLASLPARTKIKFTNSVDQTKPKLHVLAIGINQYVDRGWISQQGNHTQFGILRRAVNDAVAIGDELKRAGSGLYDEVLVVPVLDRQATIENLEAVVTQMALQIHPRDTFVLFAAGHGYSHEGRFYLIPQDYQGGTNPTALTKLAINQARLQDWIGNRIKARKALILLDTCESGALTSGYWRSRVDDPAADASIGRLHEATGRPVLTAAAQGQDALEFRKMQHGIFTSALIDALRHSAVNEDGLVMLSALVAHVQDLVPKLIKDPKEREAMLRRGSAGGPQSARFGSRGENFPIGRRLQ